MTLAPSALVVLALATHRLGSLWFEEIGRPLRTWLARRGPWCAYLSGCGYCLSVWAAFAVLALWAVPIVGPLVIAGLALSDGALFLDHGVQWLRAGIEVTRVRALLGSQQIAGVPANGGGVSPAREAVPRG